MHFVHTTRFRRGKLPHWEVEGGRYFVTVRLADSLPHEVVARLQEIHCALSAIEPASEQFAALQRQYFRTLEKYLDAGTGSCALGDPRCAQLIAKELTALADWAVEAPHFTIMPNHWHALLVPRTGCVHSLGQVMKRLKGRTAKRLRSIGGGGGAVWQREWFDRWMRDDSEWEKTIAYIHNNPVKAGLAATWQEHPWTK
ncbi:MAG: transposase [Opitutaceae bacterium]|nr:transposase [Opitutaceae bacterium]